MMADLFFALLRLATWLDPDDAASLFMAMVIGGTALIVVTIFWIVKLIDRRRDRVRLSTETTCPGDPYGSRWREDDPHAFGDHVELPRVLPREPSRVAMPGVLPTRGPRPPQGGGVTRGRWPR